MARSKLKVRKATDRTPALVIIIVKLHSKLFPLRAYLTFLTFYDNSQRNDVILHNCNSIFSLLQQFVLAWEQVCILKEMDKTGLNDQKLYVNWVGLVWMKIFEVTGLSC